MPLAHEPHKTLSNRFIRWRLLDRIFSGSLAKGTLLQLRRTAASLRKGGFSPLLRLGPGADRTRGSMPLAGPFLAEGQPGNNRGAAAMRHSSGRARTHPLRAPTASAFVAK